MATHSAPGRAIGGSSIASLQDRIEAAVNDEPYRPWCVHRLHEELADAIPLADREHMFLMTQLAADQLAAMGRIQREEVNAVTIGVHCQDTLYWSPQAGKRRVEEFGPDYESPTLLRRLGAHFQCHGL
ncbi:MAG TPA: hypothetical protein VJQ43_04350 [Thermoplasmata archaeon]|nr:hypothetical protein [Thermoplasmata archaeon]